MVVSVLFTVMVIFLLSAGITTYDTPNVANQYVGVAVGSANGINSQVFNPIQVSSNAVQTNNQTNRTHGFFAQIQVFTGLAFVFDGIGNIILALLNLPIMIQTIMVLPLTLLGFATPQVITILTLFRELIVFVILMVGISAWLKYNVRSDA